MTSIWDRIVIHWIIMLVLHELAQVDKNIDWAGFKTKADAAIRAKIPGTWLDDDAVAAADFVIDKTKAVLENRDALEAILELLAAQDWEAALARLKDLILGSKAQGMVMAALAS